MIYRLLISAFMFALRPAFKIAAWRSPDFSARLARESFYLKIIISEKTSSYSLERGRWRSGEGSEGGPPDLLIEWKNAQAAWRCLLHWDAADIIKSHMAALVEGRLALEFSLTSVYRFGLLLNLMAAALKGDHSKGEA